MNKKILKNTGVIVVCLIFLCSSVITVNAVKIQSDADNKDEEDIVTKEVTFLRCGLDGSVQEIKINLNLENGKDLGEIIADKCDQLFRDDQVFNNFFQNNSNNSGNRSTPILTFGFFSWIKSHGRGFHFKTKTKVRFSVTLRLFKLALPKIRLRFRTPTIFCKYNDIRANTTIKPLLNKNVTKNVEGNHSILVRNFVGYTGWVGRFSNSPFDLIPRGFSGYARFVFASKLS